MASNHDLLLGNPSSSYSKPPMRTHLSKTSRCDFNCRNKAVFRSFKLLCQLHLTVGLLSDVFVVAVSLHDKLSMQVSRIAVNGSQEY